MPHPHSKSARARILVRQGLYIEDIMAQIGCSDQTVRYAAYQKGLIAHRRPKTPDHKVFEGVLAVQHRGKKEYSCSGKINYPHTYAPIPITALRAAGFMGESLLAFKVVGESIIVTKVPVT